MRRTPYILVLGMAILLGGSALLWQLSGGALGSRVALASPDGGVTADAIVFGQTAALGGPAAALGLGMKEGLDAAFEEANKAGGVKGHRLSLISLDDGYEPARAAAAAKTLIGEDHVFALVGSVGTPTSIAVQPIASEAGVPFVGAFTGAEFLREPYNPGVINLRASYFEETAAMVYHLTKDLAISRIAIFYQDDSFGQAGLAGVTRALEGHQMTLVAEGKYERNTVAVEPALAAIRKADPEAVIMIGAYQPCAEFIKLARAANFSPVFVNISFVGSDALAQALGPAGAGVVVTQVVPFPKNTKIPVVEQYQSALERSSPEAFPGFVSLEGYLVGRLLIAAIGKIPGDITRTALVDAIKSTGTFDLGGFRLRYGPDNNRGSDDVFLTQIQPNGSFQPVERLSRAGG
jgi:branched-chain amino acid transport system substrate-binding protein